MGRQLVGPATAEIKAAVSLDTEHFLRDQPMDNYQTSSVPSSEIAIFSRILKLEDDDLSHDLARYVLTLGFEEKDRERMQKLAEGNQTGSLSLQEQEELQSYVKAGHLLALLHSKARKSIHRKKVS